MSWICLVTINAAKDFATRLGLVIGQFLSCGKVVATSFTSQGLGQVDFGKVLLHGFDVGEALITVGVVCMEQVIFASGDGAEISEPPA